MLIRLLLALLLASFAAPTLAFGPACHGDGTMPAMHHGAPAAPEKAPPPHVCTGCVPLADWLGARVAPPIPAPAPGPVVRIATLDPGRTGPPVLPPPRRG